MTSDTSGRRVLDALIEKFKAQWPEVDELAIHLDAALNRVSRAMTAELDRFLALNAVDIGSSGYATLRTLYFAENRELPQHEIGRTLGIGRMGVTKRIDSLERDGLVQRKADAKDRRVTIVQLTAAGVELSMKLLPMVASFMARESAALSREEKLLFIDLLRSLWYDTLIESRNRDID